MITIYFKTYGCQANVADSDQLISYLNDLGCITVDTEAEADLIIVNTCAIREKAEQKLYSYLGSLLELKEGRPYIRIGVIGCVASYRKKEIYDRFAHISFVFGAREEVGALHAYLVEVVMNLETAKQLVLNSPDLFSAKHFLNQDRDIKAHVAERKLVPAVKASCVVDEDTNDEMPVVAKRALEVKRAFINIMSGCDNYCSYCIVPFTRGREKSFAVQEIVARVEREVLQGAKEITLIGQNVNSFKDPETGANFATLLETVAQIPGEFWVRYISPHPKDMTDDVLDTMAKYPEKLCWWVHLPLQAGSDRILDAMKRTYSVEHYLSIVDKIRERMPSATITTDIIVGFPGEEDVDYEGTRAVMDRVRYDLIFSFMYSPRRYTRALKLGDPVPAEVKQRRLEALNVQHQATCLENNRKNIGKTMRVLVEKRFDGNLLARTAGNIRVLFNGPDELIGTFQYVTIHDAGPVNLEGEHVADVKENIVILRRKRYDDTAQMSN